MLQYKFFLTNRLFSRMTQESDSGFMLAHYTHNGCFIWYTCSAALKTSQCKPVDIPAAVQAEYENRVIKYISIELVINSLFVTINSR